MISGNGTQKLFTTRFEILGPAVTTMRQVKNLIGRVRKNKRAARAART